MKPSERTVEFRKTAGCPASVTLLSFQRNDLPPEASTSVKDHLEKCDFCNAELPLLAHHRPDSGAYRVPEIPMNLRMLAESILGRNEVG